MQTEGEMDSADLKCQLPETPLPQDTALACDHSQIAAVIQQGLPPRHLHIPIPGASQFPQG